MFSEEAMVDEAILRVKVVKYHVGIAGMACSENDNLEVFAQVLQDFLGMRSNVDACLNHLACGKGDGKFDVKGRCQCIVAVNQRLIEVKDHRFASYMKLEVP